MKTLFLKNTKWFTQYYFSTKKSSTGFTLVEMVVSLGLFTIILFIATSAFLSVINADRKSRSTRIAVDNLNLALEDISRKIKTGTNYSCNGLGDCATGSDFSFIGQDTVYHEYKRGVGPLAIAGGTALGGCGSILYTINQGCILRADGASPFMLATSPEIDINNLKFIVSGSPVWSDVKQPSVVIVIDGMIGANSPNQAGMSKFKIQTTVTQRSYDH